MGRPVMLGNGALTVGLNESGLVHDFYYPYVGLDNLANARSPYHKLGVFIDGQFSWVDSDEWQIRADFSDKALVSEVTMVNESRGLRLVCNDFVDAGMNAFCRRISVQNLTDRPRSVRVFFHQAFQISRGGRGDTALYEPDENYILDYKGRCSLLIYSQKADKTPFDQFCVGNYEIEGKEGTWRDAEDGELSGNAVEHGGVDSVIANSLELAQNGEEVIHYWIVAADSQYSAERIHRQLLSEGLEDRLTATKSSWSKWLAVADESVSDMPGKHQSALRKSLMLIKAHTDKRGGIIASCDSSIYNYGRDYYSYVWPRDGALAMWPLIRLGYTEEPKRFFEFCRDIMHPDGYMLHKYQPDKAIGSTWHPLLHGKHTELAIQEDETAVVVYMLYEYFKESDDQEFAESLYATLIQPMANFMVEFRDEQTKLPHASYDLWEEKFLTNTYTVALVQRALKAAAKFADLFEFPDDAVLWRTAADEMAENLEVFFDPERHLLRKGYLLQEDGSLQFDNTLDVSTAYGAMMFGSKAFDKTHIRETYAGIENILLDKSPSGGSPRYEHDNYFESNPPYMGNPWIITTLWVAQYYLQINEDGKAAAIIDWTFSHALPSGALSEQINPADGSPISVLPLVWSHAELINTLLDLHS